MSALSIEARADLHSVSAVAMRAPAEACRPPASAILIVDETLDVVGADAAGRRLLASGTGLRLVLGRLSTGRAALDLRIRSAIAKGEAVRDVVPPPDGGRAPSLLLTVTPMAALATQCAGRSEGPAQAFLRIEAAVDRAEESIAMIRRVCGLTGAETETLRLIFKGLSTIEAASVLGIAKSTARTHLQRVFAKTETSRQSELVHFVGTWDRL